MRLSINVAILTQTVSIRKLLYRS